MKFDIYGPYDVPRTKYGKTKLITKDSISLLHSEIDNEEVSNGCGCYIFALRASKGYTPWYVGQASKMRLIEESMNLHNREKYNKITAAHKGTPVMFYIPKLTSGGKFAKPTKKANGELKAVNFLEEWLIATALQKNPKLVNRQNTHFLKHLHVRGLFNSKHGESHSRSQELKRAIF
jgi:hypothetical protein